MWNEWGDSLGVLAAGISKNLNIVCNRFIHLSCCPTVKWSRFRFISHKVRGWILLQRLINKNLNIVCIRFIHPSCWPTIKWNRFLSHKGIRCFFVATWIIFFPNVQTVYLCLIWVEIVWHNLIFSINILAIVVVIAFFFKPKATVIFYLQLWYFKFSA